MAVKVHIARETPASASSLDQSQVVLYQDADGKVTVIFDSGELVENSVISILETTAADGKNCLKGGAES